jgi:hypothetical protein
MWCTPFWRTTASGRARPPFLAGELGDAFSLSRALQIGLVPLIWGAEDPQATLAAYASLYLQEEVQAEALVRQIGDFSRFLEVISFSQAVSSTWRHWGARRRSRANEWIAISASSTICC